MLKVAFRLFFVVFGFSLGLPAQGALVGRDLDGNAGTFEAYYDTVLDMTWLADANLAASNTFGVSGIGSDGSMSQYSANSWIMQVNASNSGRGYFGYSDWRLPTLTPLNGISFNTSYFSYDGSTDTGVQVGAPVSVNNPNGQSEGFTGSELAYMYYVTLGAFAACYGTGSDSQGCLLPHEYGVDDATNVTNLGLFSNVQHAKYWTDMEEAGTSNGWSFSFTSGLQGRQNRRNAFHAWVVRSGDVAVVPIPGAVWLFGGALIGLMGLRRK